MSQVILCKPLPVWVLPGTNDWSMVPRGSCRQLWQEKDCAGNPAGLHYQWTRLQSCQWIPCVLSVQNTVWVQQTGSGSLTLFTAGGSGGKIETKLCEHSEPSVFHSRAVSATTAGICDD